MAKLRLSACLYISVFILIFSSAAFAVSITYTYDSLNRITSVDYGNGFTESYTYDAAGNRITLVAQYEKIPPTSGITSPADSSSIWGYDFTISGTASDTGGSGIEKVEISTDGGLTWTTCTGTTTWSCTINFSSDGTYTIISRVTDNVGNVETIGTGTAVTVAIRQPGDVAVNGRQISVNGNPFTIKGVGYAPTPIGDDPETGPPYGDYFTPDYSSIYDRCKRATKG